VNDEQRNAFRFHALPLMIFPFFFPARLYAGRRQLLAMINQPVER
jgi:hypothetical protein